MAVTESVLATAQREAAGLCLARVAGERVRGKGCLLLTSTSVRLVVDGPYLVV